MKSIKQIGADESAAIGFSVAECSLGVVPRLEASAARLPDWRSRFLR